MGSDNFLLFNDITLRDGEQAAGVHFFPEEKLKIAEQLVRMNVPIIEAGFPIASKSDFEGVRLIASKLGGQGGPVVCAMARADKKDISCAFEALKSAHRPRIQVVLATSDIHLTHKLEMTREEALDLAFKTVQYARTLVDDVEFAAEDAMRSDRDYLYQVFRATMEAGASTLEIPDTVGYSTPGEYAETVAGAVRNIPEGQKVTIATHCHNDLGLATANTLAGILAGARQAETTINGIGERAGNAPFEEVVMALKTRESLYQIACGINTKEIMNTSKLISELISVPISPFKPIVGLNAFRHESGIHQHGMIRNRQTYQIMDPETIGAASFDLTLGKHSGKHALRAKLNEFGVHLEEEKFEAFCREFKDMACKKKSVRVEDLLNLANRFSQFTAAHK